MKYKVRGRRLDPRTKRADELVRRHRPQSQVPTARTPQDEPARPFDELPANIEFVATKKSSVGFHLPVARSILVIRCPFALVARYLKRKPESHVRLLLQMNVSLGFLLI